MIGFPSNLVAKVFLLIESVFILQLLLSIKVFICDTNFKLCFNFKGLQHLYGFTIASCQYTFCDCLRKRNRRSYVNLDSGNGNEGVDETDNPEVKCYSLNESYYNYN